jgi:6-phosphogluconolactonase
VTRVSVLADPEAAAAHAATEVARVLREAVERRGVAHLSLAGGSTPRRAYELLASLLDDWSAVELWYGDERCVEPRDPASNHQLVAESLLARVAVALPREHRIRGELGPEAAARAYAALLRARVPPAAPGEADGGTSGLPALDLAVLGLGEDGHTASLFPGHPAVEDSSGALCLPVRGAPKPPPERVTLSLPVLRAARRRLLLVTGAAKAGALAAVLAGQGSSGQGGREPSPHIPASLLVSAGLCVVADAAAAPAGPAGESKRS